MKYRLKQVFIALIFLLFLCASVRAAFEPKGYGTTFIASGYSGIASDNAAFALFINPAKLALIPSPGIDLFYRNFYQLADLSQITFSSVIPVWGAPLGFGISRFGNKLYAETDLRVAAAWRIWQPFILAASANIYHLQIKRYGSAVSFGFCLAFNYKVNADFSTAFLISNLNEPRIGAARERLPVYASLGFCYRFFDQLSANLDIVQEEGRPFDYRFGIRYRVQPWFRVMGGFRDIVNSFTTGFDVNYASLRVGYALEYHPILGVSHSISTSYAF